MTVQQAVATTLVEMHARDGPADRGRGGEAPAPWGHHRAIGNALVVGVARRHSRGHVAVPALIEWWGSYLVTEKSGRAAGTRTTRTRRGAGARTPGVGVSPNTSSTPGGRRDRRTPPRSPRGARSELGKAVGKPKKIGIDNEKWWPTLAAVRRRPSTRWPRTGSTRFARGARSPCGGSRSASSADSIASMAVKIPDDSIWIVGRDPILGRPVYGYGLIPEPDDTLVAPPDRPGNPPMGQPI